VGVFNIRAYDSFDVPMPVPDGVTVAPQRWSAQAVGGHYQAEIRMESSNAAALLHFATWLGYRLEIVNERGSAVWWGDVVEVEVAAGGMLLGTSLRGLANKVMVYYSRPMAGGAAEKAETEWDQDDMSVAQFGTWERRVTGTGYKSDADAIRLRDTLLTRTAYPAKTLRLGDEGQYATIRCAGYWQRLARVYWASEVGLVEYSENPIALAEGSGGDAVAAAAWPLGLGFTSSLVAFHAGEYMIAEMAGKFANFTAAGLQVKVSGSASNNGVFTLAGADEKEAVSYTNTSIAFDANDDITDTAGGLGFLDVGELIQISGSSGNSGSAYVKTAKNITAIEVSPGYGGTISTEAAGPSITLKRGNSVIVEEAVTDEEAGSAVTVAAYGQKLYQPFTAPDASIDWTVDQVELQVRAVGTPVDSLRVRLYTDSAGTPGSLLETVDVAGSSLSTTSTTWTAWDFANSQALNDSTTYGLEVSRTGSADADNYYEVALDSAGGYGGGTLKMHDGSAYQTPAAAQSLLFRMLDAEDTATQVATIVRGTSTGLYGASVENISAVNTNQFRDGERTGLDEAESLLDMGTSTGGRMLASVTQSEMVRIYGQNAPNDSRFVYTMDKRLLHKNGGVADEGLVPVGEWVHLDSAYMLPSSWASLSPFFVERAEYQAGSGLTLTPEANEDYDIGYEIA
jgi:hypothetical protein